MGKVYLIGAGPGDPGLITWKGMQLLKACDVVIYDRLASDRLLPYVKDDCEKIYVGKASGSHSMKQEEINRIIVEKAKTNKVVVRLKGGDPYVFGRGGEEALILREHGISYEVVPGVTSAIAALSYVGIPITHRGVSQSFHVITGHTAEEEEHLPQDMKHIAKLEGTIVILMGLGNLYRIRDDLLAKGKPKDTPAAVISNGTTSWQIVVKGTLQDICGKVEATGIKSPAIIVIGNVAELDLRSDHRGILSGVKVGITGTPKLLEKLSSRLEELGAGVEVISSTEVMEYKNNNMLYTMLEHIDQYDWLVLTSPNAVHITLQQLKARKIDYRRLAQIKFAVIGTGTGQTLQQYGYQADFIPKQSSVISLAKELSLLVGDKERIMIPRANRGSEELIHILRKENKTFDEVKIYDVIDNDVNDENNRWVLDSFDYLTFASSSGVHGFMNRYRIKEDALSEKTKIICIGDATDVTLKEYGFSKVLVAGEANVQGMIEIICEDHRTSVGKQKDGGFI